MSDTGEMSPDDILDALPLLVTMKYISPDAYALGAQVCIEMKRLGVRQLIYGYDRAVRTYSRQGGVFVVGPPKDDDITFITSLQELHFRGGLLNAFDEARLYEPDTAKRHITISPVQHINRHYSRVTPIYFRINPIPKEHFHAWLLKLVNDEMSPCTQFVGE